MIFHKILLLAIRGNQNRCTSLSLWLSGGGKGESENKSIQAEWSITSWQQSENLHMKIRDREGYMLCVAALTVR